MARSPSNQYYDAPEYYPSTVERQPGLEAPPAALPAHTTAAVSGFAPAPQQKAETVCGLRPVTAILSVLLAVVIIAAAVGGGVGGSIAVNNAKAAAGTGDAAIKTVTSTAGGSTVTPSPTTGTIGGPTPFFAPTNVLLPVDCPNINGSRQSISLGSSSWTFTPYCGADFRDVEDLVAVIVYSLHDCLQACSSFNRNAQSNKCNGIVFNPYLQASVASNFGTCFLKPSMQTPFLSGRNDFVSAILV